MLVDPWPKAYYRGWCEGRLRALGFWPRVQMLQLTSQVAAKKIAADSVDFVYGDQEHAYAAVRGDLDGWWPALRSGGLFGYRNYSPAAPELMRAVDEFVSARQLRTMPLTPGEIVLWK